MDSDSERTVEGKEPNSWPRRRNPLPSSFLHATSPRLRKTDNSTAIARGSLLSESFDGAFSGPDSADSWDSDTITLHSLGPLSRSPSCSDSIDSCVFTAQDKQQKRTINELNRQLEIRESDAAALMLQINNLRKQADDSRRQMLTEKQASKKFELQIRWHEDQLRQQQSKLDSMATSHRLALSLAQKKHDNLVEKLAAKIVHAEGEAKRSKQRIRELAKELDMARLREEEMLGLNEQLVSWLSEARLVASQANSTASMLMERLEERASYINELEARMLQLSATGTSLDGGLEELEELEQPKPAYGLMEADCSASSVANQCLFTEIEKATDTYSENIQFAAAPPSLPASSSKPCSENIQTQMLTNAYPERIGILYWLAVYIHMLWAFYYRLCISPMLYLAGIVIRATFGLIVPAPLARILAILLPRLGLFARPRKQ
ncbi:hypothetical protein GGI25_000035 [Coemansia spiralis]|uniref:Uncharacterized protein n=2 Tax=Coemansia TaxID=4863 RepID=A0A9W8GCH5_9FUNG|nr:hypothetical protein BX070DRAFT_232022 [Coemansia spiralis]KAJ1989857.1 hypothetical protein EDC05_004388 [Coemansia umbellata]KAJ2623087.1 hypothetical protein GGI26_002697 [Coemansia sp. RSA 1358]KAJ2681081.1 hypothetical protein GGI25_000035 [Coemansia spiralis]